MFHIASRTLVSLVRSRSCSGMFFNLVSNLCVFDAAHEGVSVEWLAVVAVNRWECNFAVQHQGTRGCALRLSVSSSTSVPAFVHLAGRRNGQTCWSNLCRLMPCRFDGQTVLVTASLTCCRVSLTYVLSLMSPRSGTSSARACRSCPRQIEESSWRFPRYLFWLRGAKCVPIRRMSQCDVLARVQVRSVYSDVDEQRAAATTVCVVLFSMMPPAPSGEDASVFRLDRFWLVVASRAPSRSRRSVIFMDVGASAFAWNGQQNHPNTEQQCCFPQPCVERAGRYLWKNRPLSQNIVTMQVALQRTSSRQSHVAG